MTANKREEILTKAKPILFNTEMVRAILDGRKTVTRRVTFPNEDLREFKSNKYPDGWWLKGRVYENWEDLMYNLKKGKSCKYQPGDILYVRESFFEFKGNYEYKADGKHLTLNELIGGKEIFKWRPSIHMRREAARIFLKVTNVRVERLQEIITGDYRTPININKEGLISSCCFCTHHNGDCKDYISQHTPKTLTCKLLEDFTLLWNSTVKKSDRDRYGWDANPWVWVIEFERVV